MKQHALLCGLLVAAVALGIGLRRTPQEADTLVWAADAEGGAPYVFQDPEHPQQQIGFEVDLADALAKQLGRPIRFQQYEFASLFSGLQRGDFDFAMNGLEITPERKSKFRFSKPYYVYKQQFVVRAGEQRFHTLNDCQGRADVVIGTLEGTVAERLLDQLGIPKKIYPGAVEPYGDLALGRIDGVFLDLPIALYYARNNSKLRFAGPAIAPGYYAIAFRPRDEALASAVDNALDRLRQSGDLRRIYEKWGLWNDDQEELGRDDGDDITPEAIRPWTPARFVPLLLEGAAVTVLVTVLSMLLAVALGLPVALARLYGPAPLRYLALGYVEFFRGIPVLLLLYFLYYGLPVVAVNLNLGLTLNLAPLQAAILGLGLTYAAYEAEIYRAGISALPAGQWEAAAALGMSPSLAFRRVILPQAIRIILPPMTSDFVALFKDTSVVSVIAVVELSKQYQILSKASLQYLEIGLATAALYLALSVPLGHLSRYLEKKWGKAPGE
jgi:polar amino acid transport system substrate-binding protein